MNMQQVIRSKDFYENLQITRHLEKADDQLIDPCSECSHRKACSDQEMSCEQYRAYSYQNTSFNNVAMWQAKDKTPSKQIFKELNRRRRG